MEYFRRLGDRIRDAYAARGCRADELSGIACQALTEMPPDEVSGRDILSWVRTTEALPRQQDIEARFAQPPITVYAHEHFYIAALFWDTATTTIHQHAFTGAFAVIDGASVEARYQFQVEDVLDPGPAEASRGPRLLLGQLSLEEVNTLERGDIRPIECGAGFIHSVFHLDAPSVSLVVRNYQNEDAAPQYDYFAPRVAVDPYCKDPLGTRRVQCLRLLSRLDSPEFMDAAIETIVASPALTAFRVLQYAHRSRERECVDFERLLDAARDACGAWIDSLPAVFAEEERRLIISGRRRYLRQPEQRYLLALLYHLDERRAILDKVAERVPGRNPRDTVVEWAAGMSGTQLVGIEFDELNTEIFRLLLSDVEPVDIPTRLAHIYDPEDIARESDTLVQHIQLMRETEVFSTLLA